jgi:glutamine amidotransferase
MGEQSVSPYDLLFAPDNSLIRQTWDPKFMSHIQNLAGFGMIGWDDHSTNPELPYFYKTQELPFFDSNLLHLSKKTRVNTMLSHVRGVDYSTEQIVTRQNAHPFIFPDHKIALAHNGSIANMEHMKGELIKYVKPYILKHISGSTDSERIYAVFISRLKDPTNYVPIEEAREALIETLEIFRTCRKKLGITKASPSNLFVTNGEYSIITRFVFDYGCHGDDVELAFLKFHSLWFTYGEVYGFHDGIYKMVGAEKKRNIIFASEPLTNDHTTWVELPEYSMTTAWKEDGEIHLHTLDLNV